MDNVDRTALKFNQASIVFFVSTAFLFNQSWLILVTAVIMLTGIAFPKAGFKFLYAYIFKPAGILKSDIIEEDNSPHIFAQGLGSVFLITAYFFLEFFPHTYGQIIGWSISLVVAVLAFINIVLNFCTGCFIYFQLQRFGIIQSQSRSRHV